MPVKVAFSHSRKGLRTESRKGLRTSGEHFWLPRKRREHWSRKISIPVKMWKKESNYQLNLANQIFLFINLYVSIAWVFSSIWVIYKTSASQETFTLDFPLLCFCIGCPVEGLRIYLGYSGNIRSVRLSRWMSRVVTASSKLTNSQFSFRFLDHQLRSLDSWFSQLSSPSLSTFTCSFPYLKSSTTSTLACRYSSSPFSL